MENKNIDRTNLTQDQVAQLDQYEASQKQLKAFEEMGQTVEQLVITLEQGQTKEENNTEKLGALLTDMRTQLADMASKESPKAPDYAKPVVVAVSKLETSLAASLKAINVQPQVNVPETRVNVASPDLSGVEKLLKNEVPKAFQSAIKAIPKTEIPKADYTPVLESLSGLSEQLLSIENATRMKPLPGNMGILVNGKSVSTANPLPTDATFSGTVTTAPTFKEDPSDTGEDPKYGKVDSSGNVQVDVVSTPSGAATEAKQDSEIGELASIGTNTANTVFYGSAVNDKLPGTIGQTNKAGSLSVTVASDQTIPISGTVAVTGAGDASAANQTTEITRLTSIRDQQTDKSQFTKMTDGTDTALITAAGEQNVLATAQPGVDIGDITVNNASGSGAVNIQDGGNSITIDAASLPLPTGAATSVLQITGNTSLSSVDTKLTSQATASKQDTGNASLSSIDGKITAVNTGAVVVSSSALPSGAATGTKQDTGNVSLASIDSKLSGTLSVDDSQIDIRQASSSTVTSVNSSATNVTLLALNANRRMATFYNESTQTLFLKFGATASTSSYTVEMSPEAYYELPTPCYTGIIDGIWSSANGSCKVTELA